eukprot:gene20695-7626_t
MIPYLGFTPLCLVYLGFIPIVPGIYTIVLGLSGIYSHCARDLHPSCSGIYTIVLGLSGIYSHCAPGFTPIVPGIDIPIVLGLSGSNGHQECFL